MRGVKRFVLAIVVLASPAYAQTTLYEGARLIPGDGKPAIERSAFVVENGAITRVGREGEVKAISGLQETGPSPPFTLKSTLGVEAY